MSWLPEIAPRVGLALVGVFVLLLAATGIVQWLTMQKGREATEELRLRVRSWWFMIGIFTFALLVDRLVSVIFLGFVSFLALKEYFSLIPTRRIDRAVVLWAYLAIPVQFYWAAIEWYGMFIVFIPVWMFLFFPALMTLRGQVEGHLRAVGALSWGLMMTVFTISHTAFLLTAGDQWNPVAGGAGLLLFLVFLTQFNDVAMFTWGKLLGRRRITPSVSPNKTWEGFIGGCATSAVAGAAIAPYLTMMGIAAGALSGLMIAVAGFVGDVTLSALKRDLGVKDSGGLIPGHGGILDRVDSLIYSAPVFFHFIGYAYAP